MNVPPGRSIGSADFNRTDGTLVDESIEDEPDTGSESEEDTTTTDESAEDSSTETDSDLSSNGSDENGNQLSDRADEVRQGTSRQSVEAPTPSVGDIPGTSMQIIKFPTPSVGEFYVIKFVTTNRKSERKFVGQILNTDIGLDDEIEVKFMRRTPGKKNDCFVFPDIDDTALVKKDQLCKILSVTSSRRGRYIFLQNISGVE